VPTAYTRGEHPARQECMMVGEMGVKASSSTVIFARMLRRAA
jgi:hypothetical protein